MQWTASRSGREPFAESFQQAHIFTIFVKDCQKEQSAHGDNEHLFAETPFTSAMAAWEAIIVLSRPDQLNCTYLSAHDVVAEWLDLRNIEVREIPTPKDVLLQAVMVAQEHGIGKRALSNFDCFHYAYAKVTGVPLLTLDNLLRKTDIATLPGAH